MDNHRPRIPSDYPLIKVPNGLVPAVRKIIEDHKGVPTRFTIQKKGLVTAIRVPEAQADTIRGIVKKFGQIQVEEIAQARQRAIDRTLELVESA
jgi:hypothetical protein